MVFKIANRSGNQTQAANLNQQVPNRKYQTTVSKPKSASTKPQLPKRKYQTAVSNKTQAANLRTKTQFKANRKGQNAEAWSNRSKSKTQLSTNRKRQNSISQTAKIKTQEFKSQKLSQTATRNG